MGQSEGVYRSPISPSTRDYVGLLTFIFAINEINQDPSLLPNVTLGYQIYDTCGDEIKSFQNILQILSGGEKEAPNYSCRKYGEVVGFVGDLYKQAQFLDINGYPMISHVATAPPTRKNNLVKSFYTTQKNNMAMVEAAVLYLKHFGWNLVGLIMSKDLYKETEQAEMVEFFKKEEICFEYIIIFRDIHAHSFQEKLNMIENSISRVLIVAGQLATELKYLLNLSEYIQQNVTLLILNMWWYNTITQPLTVIHACNCSLSFSILGKTIPGLGVFISTVDPTTHPTDPLLEDIWYYANHCNISNLFRLRFQQWVNKFTLQNCTGLKLQIPAEFVGMYVDSNYYVYSAVYSLAHALHDMQMIGKGNGKESRSHQYTHKFPQSRCNEKCSPGYRKARDRRHLVCCYDCVPCSKGEMSNLTDSEICHRCPTDHWPDETKVKCLPKPYEFLSYKSDVFALVFSVFVVFFSIVTGFILGLFITHWDTPIVKANNRTVSVILLVSILLSFLSVFCFLGRPVDITCKLRQTSFSVFFTIAVSSVLSKTITVCIAFKATQPRSSWKKLVGLKLANYIVLLCSTIQVMICIIWLTISPPYLEFDMVNYAGKIIIQCNEGSVIAFYSMLGYMGFLAAVSFVLAFMVRTLPDSFNEAKYITFSMLVFCSVWIAMIPAYFSTKGKYTVAVEVFAILTSSAGILGCIFLPKCYIMLLKPELNIRKGVLKKKIQN
ncbi:vomeronasal type-2 receptor 26-like [Rhinoderma darwinii]|uniref:vomeronasal type-2 receptor 26-like n=1 Tax=Rhinoderma darwinii TaxID=43563 RepID=UPI003F67F238